MLTELRAYLMLSDSCLIFFKFDLHKVDIEKRKRLFQLPNHPNPLVPIGIWFNAAYKYIIMSSRQQSCSTSSEPAEAGGWLFLADSISVHRLEAFDFNVIFAIIFIREVLTYNLQHAGFQHHTLYTYGAKQRHLRIY